MEFNEKIQYLRKEKNLTQEELAELLYVSRAAISKWESGRGYPSIESLKAISEFFSISLDDLLSGKEIIAIAENENKEKNNHTKDLVFGLLDIAISMFLFLPFFAQKNDNIIESVPLLMLQNFNSYVMIPYYFIIFSLVITGICLLAMQNYKANFWIKNKHKISLILSTIGTFLFIASLEPYAATLTLIFLIIKVLIMIKNP